MRVTKDISRKIIIVGPYYKNARGGVASILNIYSKYYDEFHFIPTNRSISNKSIKAMYFFAALLRFLVAMLSANFRIVHIHGSSHVSFKRKRIFIYLSRIFRKKIIYHCHGSEFKIFFEGSSNPKAIASALLKCDRVIVLSQSWKDFFSTIINADRISILNNIVEKPKIEKLSKADNVLRFVFLGIIGKRKGIFDLLDVLNENKDLFQRKLHLFIGGNGEVEKLCNYLEEKSLQGLVSFLGWIDEQKKSNLLASADVYILPSYNEGLPVSILEAMSYGLAIISTATGGIPEVVENQKNGLILEPGNREQIKEAILYAVNSPERIAEFGKESQKRIEKFYPENVIKELTEIYSALLRE